MRCESGFHFIEPPVRPRKEVPRDSSRIELTVAEPPELQTRDADIHGHSWCRNPEILGHPVVFSHRVPEPLPDRARHLRVVEIRQEKTKIIAAEAGMQGRWPLSIWLIAQQIRAPNLTAQKVSNPFQHPIARGMAQRVVQGLEGGDVCHAERTPPSFAVHRQRYLDVLHESTKKQKLSLGVA